jgi:hypothetical protein
MTPARFSFGSAERLVRTTSMRTSVREKPDSIDAVRMASARSAARCPRRSTVLPSPAAAQNRLPAYRCRRRRCRRRPQTARTSRIQCTHHHHRLHRTNPGLGRVYRSRPYTKPLQTFLRNYTSSHPTYLFCISRTPKRSTRTRPWRSALGPYWQFLLSCIPPISPALY